MACSNTRIVLLGQTGAGKSSLANTVFGEKAFTVGHNASSETKKCTSKTGFANGREITVIDTPGFFDTDEPEEKMKPEIVSCITKCSPGPHAFLLVFKVDKVTEQQKAVVTKIREYFSKEAFKYATVVFTHGDQLDDGQTIKDFVSENKWLHDLVELCGGRCHVIDNKYWFKNPVGEYRSNGFQVEELLKTIEKTVEENKGGCYTNEMLQEVEKEIQKEMENISKSAENMSERETREQAKANVFMRILNRVACLATGALLGAFLGVSTMVCSVVKILQSTSNVQNAIHLITGITFEHDGAAVAAAGGGGGIAYLTIATAIVTLAAVLIGLWKGYKAKTPAKVARKIISLPIRGVRFFHQQAKDIVENLEKVEEVKKTFAYHKCKK